MLENKATFPMAFSKDLSSFLDFEKFYFVAFIQILFLGLSSSWLNYNLLFGFLVKKVYSTCNGKAKDYFKMKIKEENL